MKYLKFDETECTGCLSCQLICSFQRLNFFNPQKASLSIERVSLEEMRMNYCRHCQKPLCLEACNFDAMRLAEGVVVIDEDKCTGCEDCITACPFNAVFKSKESVYKCDQCQGEFKCTTVCTTRALKILEK